MAPPAKQADEVKKVDVEVKEGEAAETKVEDKVEEKAVEQTIEEGQSNFHSVSCWPCRLYLCTAWKALC